MEKGEDKYQYDAYRLLLFLEAVQLSWASAAIRANGSRSTARPATSRGGNRGARVPGFLWRISKRAERR